MTRKDAMDYRDKIEAAASTMTDETALTAVELFPAWAVGKHTQSTTGRGTTARCINACRRTHHKLTGHRTRPQHCG